MEFTSYDVRWQATVGGPVQVYVAQAPREKLDDLLRRAIGVEDLDSVPFLEVWGNHAGGNIHVIRDGGKLPIHSYVVRNKGILAAGSATLLQLVNAQKEAKNKLVPLTKQEQTAKKKAPKQASAKEQDELYKFEKVSSVTREKFKELK